MDLLPCAGQENGEGGFVNAIMNIDEIAKRTQLTSVQVARRTSDMHKRGMAEPTGSTRLSASGRNERVWGQ